MSKFLFLLTFQTIMLFLYFLFLPLLSFFYSIALVDDTSDISIFKKRSVFRIWIWYAYEIFIVLDIVAIKSTIAIELNELRRSTISNVLQKKKIIIFSLQNVLDRAPERFIFNSIAIVDLVTAISSTIKFS